jgi:hypothetical protein
MSQTENALKNMDIAFLVIGFFYDTKVWQRDFLKIVENVFSGCKIHITLYNRTLSS